MIYFTADTHFFHKSVINFENRPFKDIYEMNEVIVFNWNDIVNPSDDIYILGDISFGRTKDTLDVIKSLKGRKHLVRGNHDKKMNVATRSEFVWIKDYFKLKVGDVKYILFHYPIYAWDGKDKGSYHLHGHTHTNSHSDIQLPKKINVGMDHWNYKPVSIEQIIHFRELELNIISEQKKI